MNTFMLKYYMIRSYSIRDTMNGLYIQKERVFSSDTDNMYQRYIKHLAFRMCKALKLNQISADISTDTNPIEKDMRVNRMISTIISYRDKLDITSYKGINKINNKTNKTAMRNWLTLIYTDLIAKEVY